MPSLGRIFLAHSSRRIASAAVTAALLAGACLALAPGARAAAAPTNLPIADNSPGAGFILTGPTDVAQFKVKATAGQDLFVGLGVFYDLRLQILDPAGKLVRTFDANGASSDYIAEGVELHPAVSGTYTLRVAGQPDASKEYPYTDMNIWAYPDCRGGPATKCAIGPGKTRKGSFGGSNDDDAFVVKAPAGRSYAAVLEVADSSDTLYASDLKLIDGRGEVVQSQGTGSGPARRNKATLKFRLPASGGPFYLQAHPHPATSLNFRGTFTLSLTQQ